MTERKFKKGDKVISGKYYSSKEIGIVQGYIEVKGVTFVLLESSAFYLEEELELL